MKTSLLFALPVLLLTACSGGMGGGPTTPAQAKADNTTFLDNLPAAARQTALFCQAQIQSQLGGTIYLIAAPSMQSGDLIANSTTNAIASSTPVVYDRVDGTTVTSAGRSCALHSKNLVVRPSHSE